MLIVGVVSQKGGVGKSTVARMIATSYAKASWRVLIADLDSKQSTSVNWSARRNADNVEPEIAVQTAAAVRKLIAGTGAHDMIIFDAPPHSSPITKEIAAVAHLLVIPTGCSRDDLEPAVLLGHDLVAAGVDRGKFVFLRNHVATEMEAKAAGDYIQQAGYAVLPGFLWERAGYRTAQNHGRSVIETAYLALNKKAKEVMAGVIEKLTPKKAA